MTHDKETLIRKIQKLLSLAARAGTEHEATSAAAKARELMREYNLSMDDIESLTYEDCTEEEYNLGTVQVPSYIKLLAVSVAHGYDTIPYFKSSHRKTHATVVFVGIMPDVLIAKQVFEFLLDFSKRKAREYKLTKESRVEYLQGFAMGVNKQLRRVSKEDTPQEHALALVKNAVVQDYLNRKFGKMKMYNPASVPNTLASVMGYADGRAVTIDRPVEYNTERLAIGA